MKIAKLTLLCLTLFSALSAHSKRIYIDSEELDYNNDAFYIHQGGNVWISADTIHRDTTGLYLYENDIYTAPRGEFVKKWKCPYCHQYWPIGQACQNPECPSKYE